MHETSPSNERKRERREQGHQVVTGSMATREALRNLVHELSQPLSGISINTALIQNLLAWSAERNPELADLLRELDRDVCKTRQILTRSRDLLAPAEETEQAEVYRRELPRGRHE